jgi:hypothetical protein
MEPKLIQYAKNIWLADYTDQYKLAMTFLRYQEYYESPNKIFFRKPFLISDFKDWYEKSKKSQYHLDWSGFNVPSEIIFECMEAIPDFNEWDRQMADITDFITKKTEDKFYLIGALRGDMSTLNHELAHGFYYTIPEYKKYMNNLYLELPDKVKNYMLNFLTSSGGYNPEVFPDEAQAYLSTNELIQFMFEKESNEFKKIFNEFANKHLKIKII